ncbi:DeoR/GlpR family DNA-binding transcription regulator [Geobacillus sp. YHL]|uniref:DeoR/GlpR family DNA-binding transcription regulator n=1 Tax=Geobacillus sp. YHL TaxID=2796117 RepID=UPI001EEFE639|nr:DeoR/GlpR family DNA-binding transcription regulator [Geobacillus sp. YHL]
MMIKHGQLDMTWVGNERQAHILKLVEEFGSVRVADMSKKFNVTEETIRRDLERLEREGLLKRVHGGAVSIKKNQTEIPFFRRQSINIKEKQVIAQKAATFIENGDIIALDASTTSLQMAKYIQDKEITVITNSIAVTLELAGREEVTLITIGGYLLDKSMSFVGISAQKVIDDYHVDKFFFSCTGFDVQRGVSEAHEMQAQTKKKFISISDQLFLLADHSKYGTKSLIRVADLEDVDYLITDDKMSVNDMRSIRSLGINVVLA